MYEEDVETAIKVVIVGNGAVGKSSMIQRYCKGIFTNDYKKTIGVDFLEKQIEVNGEDVRLMLWDTAGQEEFDAITKAYYRGAQACVLAFSTIDRASFDAVISWKEKVEEQVGEISMVLVQNKIDLLEESAITMEEAEELAKKLRLRFYRTSVKDNLNISDVFRYIANMYLSQVSLVINSDKLPQTIGPALSNTDNGSNNNNNHHHKRHHGHQYMLKDTITFRATNKRKNHNKKSPLFKEMCSLT